MTATTDTIRRPQTGPSNELTKSYQATGQVTGERGGVDASGGRAVERVVRVSRPDPHLLLLRVLDDAELVLR
jgi:hypothetical protein